MSAVTPEEYKSLKKFQIILFLVIALSMSLIWIVTLPFRIIRGLFRFMNQPLLEIEIGEIEE